ncbi:MAG: polyphosphate polymerase domain-containing protein, partial [Ruminococcaceae bacterium]|nr:polyphosphate polymerase domain-containing protein [Oscillospiraceae bacterium]
MKNADFRHEHKFFIESKHLLILKKRLSCLLETDAHSNEDGYTITSLYFDDYKQESLFTKLSGNSERFKWRIRRYSENSDALVLELKEKNGALVRKQRSSITKESYYAALEDPAEYDCSDKDALQQLFFANLRSRTLKPAVIVKYRRTAFIEKNTNTRITLDEQLSTGYAAFDLLNDNVHYLPVLPSGL